MFALTKVVIACEYVLDVEVSEVRKYEYPNGIRHALREYRKIAGLKLKTY
jgi:hypothetical protein